MTKALQDAVRELLDRKPDYLHADDRAMLEKALQESAPAEVPAPTSGLPAGFGTYPYEFPDLGYVMPAVHGMTDESWHNDVSPHFVGNGMWLWFDYADPAKRECDDYKRFRLEEIDADGEPVSNGFSLDSDDLVPVLVAYADRVMQPMVEGARKAWLGTAYREAVGYDPFEDNPAMTVEAVRDLWAGVLAESIKVEQ